MTVQTATTPHAPVPALGVALAGAALAVGAAFSVTQLISSDRTPVAPVDPQVVITDGARDSWEGRIGPDQARSAGHGVPGSLLPPGTTDPGLGGR